MSVKLEIAGNYLKVTDGANNPVRFPYRDVRFQANDTNESIDLFNNNLNGRLLPSISYGDVPASGSVTINTTSATHANGTVILASALVNVFSTGTAQCTSVIATNTVAINGLLYTAVAGAKADNTEFSVDTSDTACAADLADSINNDVRVGTLGVVSASPTTDTVTLTSDVLGVGGDATTLAETGGTITLSGATFSGGVDADTVVVDGLTYTAVAGAKADNTEFSTDTSDTAAATDLADSINNDVRVGTVPDDVTASPTINVVTITSENGGTVGNATTLSSSDGTRLAVNGATFEGGLNDASVSGILVNSVQVMSGAEFSGDDPNALATLVAANITAHTSTPNYTAAAVGAVITITSVVDDTAVNGYVVASTVVKATKTDVNMAGAGADIVDSNGTVFATWAALISFLEDKTGGELI